LVEIKHGWKGIYLTFKGWRQ